MTTYILFAVVVLLGTVGVFRLYAFMGRAERNRARRRLHQEERTIHWEDALDRTRRGRGYFVISPDDLAGRLWWVSGDTLDDPIALLEIVSTSGLLVTGCPSESEKDILNREGLSDWMREIPSGILID
jgi:hypothetical protein